MKLPEESHPASLQDTCWKNCCQPKFWEQRADTIWFREEAFGTVGRAEWKIVQLLIILILCCA